MKDIVIAGGGLAGSACAAALARAGKSVTIFERNMVATDKICGEFLSVEAQSYLRDLGVDLAKLGGVPIHSLSIILADKRADIELPFAGIGLSRKLLDETLLQCAARFGADIRRGRTIDGIETKNGIVVRLGLGQTIRAQTLFLATGKHDTRGLRRASRLNDRLVGFKMYFRLAQAAQAELDGKISLVLFRQGYAGLQLVDQQRANLCLLVGQERLRACGGTWPGLLRDLCEETPFLDKILRGAVALFDHPLTISRVPYGFIHRPGPDDCSRIFRLGDQAGVIPSFTGDGMAIALHSVALATSSYLRGEDAISYHNRLADDISGQIWRATSLYRLANFGPFRSLLIPLVKLMPSTMKYAANLTRVPVHSRISLG